MNEKRYFPELNLLRFMAACCIALFYHYEIFYGVYPFYNFPGMKYIYMYSGYGVELFFLISGFVMYYSYYGRIRESKINFKGFLFGRIKRLYPVMIVTVLASAAIQWLNIAIFSVPAVLDCHDERNSFFSFILSLLGLNSGWFINHDMYSINGPAWFISIIIICYVVFFALISLTKNDKLKENIGLFALIVLGVYLYLNPQKLPLLYGSCGRGYLNFFLGIVIAKSFEKIKNVKEQAIAGIGAAFVLVLFMIMFKANNLGSLDLSIVLGFNVPIFILFTTIPVFRWISDNKIVKFLGSISFSLYLWNLPVGGGIALLNSVLKLNLNFYSTGVWMSFVIVSIVISVISHFAIEKNHRFIDFLH